MRKIASISPTVIALAESIASDIDMLNEEPSDTDSNIDKQVARLKHQIHALRRELNKLTRPYPINLAEIIETNLRKVTDDKQAYARAQLTYSPTLLPHEYDLDTAIQVARTLANYFKQKGFRVNNWEEFIDNSVL